MKIIVGLGNPGKEHEKTRHNAGFMAIDEIAKRQCLDWKESRKFSSGVCKATGMILVKPLTFMNDSGRAVQAVLSYYKFPQRKTGAKTKDADLSEVLTVIHDDLDIKLGRYKVSISSRSAGHRGVQSIIDTLGTKDFKRLRLGIKTSKLDIIPADKFVLQKFSDEEMEVINRVIKEVVSEI